MASHSEAIALASAQDGEPGFSLIQRDPTAGPSRARHPVSPDAVRDVARRLFADADPTLPASHIAATTRDIPRCYTDSVHGRLQKQLFHSLTNRERLFVQGAAVGVGASVFMADYCRAFNLRCREMGDPRRVAHLALLTGTTERRFLEALCSAVQAPLTAAEARYSSPRALGERIVAQAERLRLIAIVIDHLHNANEPCRSLVGDLMMALDPLYSVPLEVEDALPRNRLGIVLVDHQAPESLFRDQPEVLALLQGACVVLPPYTSVDSVADFMRQADVGLQDLDLSDEADRLMAERVLEATDGLVASMAGLLRLVDLVGVTTGGYRPDLAVVDAALEHHRRMVKLLRSRASGRAPAFRTVARPAAHGGGAKADVGAASPSEPASGAAPAHSGAPAKPGRVKKLKEKADARHLADATRRDMLKRGYSVLPEATGASEG
jgi:hypothetical protein